MGVALAGGIGLFLLGMLLMTEGLKALAGDALRGILQRFTGGTLSALATGAAVTALVQSSSATTLATLGFVSAGLLTFVQAVGVIFGANLGTTSTGWIVSLVGFKLELGRAALPMVCAGALLRLLGRGRWAAAGTAVAGFGLLFHGISVLQDGMRAATALLTPATLPGDSFGGRLALVGLGVAMTVVLQSSSAAGATTLAALSAGSISLAQAAAMVVGQNLGTTVTAVLAALRASPAAKRTALAHVLFNGVTAVVAFALLGPLVAGLARLLHLLGEREPAVALASFHTAFNLLGVLLLAPALPRFCALLERLVPEHGARATRHLDRSVLTLGPVAVEAARRALRELLDELLAAFERGAAVDAASHASEVSRSLDAVDAALSQVRGFLAALRSSGDQGAGRSFEPHLSALHALDHLDRLSSALREREHAQRASTSADVAPLLEVAREGFAEVRAWLRGERAVSPEASIRTTATRVADLRRRGRPAVLERAARGERTPGEALEHAEALRWIDRVTYHVHRAVHHSVERGGASVEQGESYSGIDAER